MVEAEGVERYSQDVEATVYFCVLEALQNVQKYAQASTGDRAASCGGEVTLTFEVTDDGAGFDLPAKKGAGLTNMSDRLDALGGELEVTSEPVPWYPCPRHPSRLPPLRGAAMTIEHARAWPAPSPPWRRLGLGWRFGGELHGSHSQPTPARLSSDILCLPYCRVARRLGASVPRPPRNPTGWLFLFVAAVDHRVGGGCPRSRALTRSAPPAPPGWCLGLVVGVLGAVLPILRRRWLTLLLLLIPEVRLPSADGGDGWHPRR